MKKNILLVIVIFLVFLGPSRSMAADDFVADDSGIQSYNTDSVSHFSISGGIRQQFVDDSMFLLGLYGVDTGPFSTVWNSEKLTDTTSRDTLKEVKDAGFNFVYINNGWPLSLNEFDHVASFGLKTVAFLYNDFVQAKMTNNPALLTQRINEIKNHPAILAYELFDEWPPQDLFPTQASWQEIGDYARAVRAGDTRKPFFINHPGQIDPGRDGGTGCAWADISDVLSMDNYVLYYGGDLTNATLDSLKGMTDYIDEFLRCARGRSANARKPFVYILQAMKYRWPSGAGWQRMPSPAQIRGQAYAAIVHGAVGLGFFMQHVPWRLNIRDENGAYLSWRTWNAYFTGLSPQVTPDEWQEVTNVNHEITTHKAVFLSKSATDEYHIFRKGQGRIHTLLKDTGDSNVRYLLTVNLDPQPTIGKFSFAKTGMSRVISLFDNRTISFSGSFFMDEFPSYGVRLYKISFGITADLNTDGKIDIFDYNLLVGNFGKTGPAGWIPADINADGKVDIFDYNILVGNFGKIQ